MTGEITGSQVECPPPVAGTLARVVMFDFFALDYYVYQGGVISEINLLPGKFGYEFLGYPNTVSHAEDYERTGFEGFRHRAGLLIPERTQPQKENIRQICDTRVVFIVFNRDGTIELAGHDVGVEVLPGQIRNLQASEGVFSLNFSSPELEDSPMKSILNSDVVDNILQRNRYILLETGWYILLEDGSRILLE